MEAEADHDQRVDHDTSGSINGNMIFHSYLRRTQPADDDSPDRGHQAHRSNGLYDRQPASREEERRDKRYSDTAAYLAPAN